MILKVPEDSIDCINWGKLENNNCNLHMSCFIQFSQKEELAYIKVSIFLVVPHASKKWITSFMDELQIF